jgi:hypothetical protein
MLTSATRRRSLLAMAGVTAGVTSIVIGPTAVNAQTTDREPDAQPGRENVAILTEPSEPAPDSHGTCFSWTTAPGFLGTTAINVNMPTTARNNNQRHCILQRGNQTDGVFKLQDAINKCYPQFSAGVGFDGNYGANTQRAVSQIQFTEGVAVDGVYGSDTKTAMRWPTYRRDNGNFFACALVRH